MITCRIFGRAIKDVSINEPPPLFVKLRLYQSSPYNGTNGSSDHWADAKALWEAIIANGQDNNGTKFKLADTYEDLFTAGSADWSGESVFDIQRTISGSQVITNSIEGSWHTAPPGGMGTSGWGFYQPSYELVNSHIVERMVAVSG